MKKYLMALMHIFFFSALLGQNIRNNPQSNHANKFEQLGTILPTPNEYRTASGAAGSKYWQQQADYNITCELDEVNQILSGEETITYFNNSPDELSYLWLQLDENQHHPKSDNNIFDASRMDTVESVEYLKDFEPTEKRLAGLGVNIVSVTDQAKKPLSYTINQTMMRVNLLRPLRSKEKFIFNVKWFYRLPNRLTSNNARGGYEYFSEEGNYIFTIAQWYPRMCVYSDFHGWQNKQFTGRGEFALAFGNFKVSMTVPADHVIAATGKCTNIQSVLSVKQKERWAKVKTATDPVEIVTLDEAKAAEKTKSKAKKTWIFEAENVRDFAWGSSRKFVWDAMTALVEGKSVLCMSFYAKEAYGLYRPYSTKLVAHTLKVYSKFSIPYPYPVAQSVEALNGMEYPMICFNYGRTADDGTYSEEVKNGMIGVIIHEVGHNFFPMIINSDERQWTWLDEGINSFVQYLAEQHFQNGFPSRTGSPADIVDYMKLPKQLLEPIMTNSENIIQFGPNAYAKPATALNILRETIMGRELFDFAFKEYARRWAFKHPTPADFFRTMEDASGVDLDWFWRGWFYDIDHVDISLDSVKHYKVDLEKNPKAKMDTIKRRSPKPIFDLSYKRNAEDKTMSFLTDTDKSLRDFYYTYMPWKTSDSAYSMVSPSYDTLLSEGEKKKILGDKNYYQLYFTNKGGLVMPVIIEWTFADNKKEIDRIPAEVWRKNENNFHKVFMKEKEVISVSIDPLKETADIDLSNNQWPKKVMKSKFTLFKAKQKWRGKADPDNIMKRVKDREQKKK